MIRTGLGRVRRNGGRSIAGPLAKLAFVSLAFGMFLFMAIALPGIVKVHAPSLPQIVPYIGILIGMLAGAFLSSWAIGQLIGIHATRVTASFAVLPGRPESRPKRWHAWLQRHRRLLHARPLSIGCKLLGVIAFIVATMAIALLDLEQRKKAIQAGLENKDGLEGRIDAIRADVLTFNFPAYLGLIYIPATALIYLGYRLGLRSAEDVLGTATGPPANANRTAA